MTRTAEKFLALLEIISRLRAPDGCPWDQKQTPQTFKQYLVEETHELVEAINEDDPGHIREELGDLLFQVIFLNNLYQEKDLFTISEVIDSISAKMIRRHPHVFGEVAVTGSDEVVVNWEAIKNAEKGKESRKSRLDGIPNTYPALMKAKKLQVRAAKDGFDWPDAAPIWDKLEEEIGEVKEALTENDADHLEDEIGDLFFVAVNLARKLGVDPEIALQRANRKFETRYRGMETLIESRGQKLSDLDLAAQDKLWDEVKRGA